MTADFVWPEVLKPRKVMAEVVAASIDGGYENAGLDDSQDSNAEFWHIILDEIPFASKEQKWAWRALECKLEGRLNTVVVPVYNTEQTAITSEFKTGVSRGDTDAIIKVSGGKTLVPGMQFSTTGDSGDVRLYRIVAVGEPVPDGAAQDFEVSVWPQFRENMSAGEPLDFLNPACTCRMDADSGMSNGADDYAGRTLATATFEEARW